MSDLSLEEIFKLLKLIGVEIVPGVDKEGEPCSCFIGPRGAGFELRLQNRFPTTADELLEILRKAVEAL